MGSEGHAEHVVAEGRPPDRGRREGETPPEPATPVVTVRGTGFGVVLLLVHPRILTAPPAAGNREPLGDAFHLRDCPPSAVVVRRRRGPAEASVIFGCSREN